MKEKIQSNPEKKNLMKSDSNPIQKSKSNEKWLQSNPEKKNPLKNDSNAIQEKKSNEKWLQSNPEKKNPIEKTGLDLASGFGL